ncbi:SEC-C metal-binding domain-containing protein [Actinoplanes palleronii]|uniref:Preprotein translocase SecA n=1 Tax=Actinoplanes palleronii TaxID=113570 RepID=A0ABQ4B6Q7_9ACTN|nr:SEC-C metal-binding domain-containing protein [Actinoplanes palleronii]GIE66335.1 preprotein translocase SecA [Actinoplanes palleronii]
MPSDATVTLDDLDILAHQAFDLDDPMPVVADLVDAVEQNRLADPADASHALLLASELAEQAGDLPAALGYAERATTAPGGGPFARSCWAELLVKSGREDEGLEQFAAVRPELLRDPLAASYVPAALEACDRATVALEWLTEAVRTVIERAPRDEPDYAEVELLFALIKERHRVREGLELSHDDLDDLYHEMEAAVEAPEPDEGRAVLFWPEPELATLLARWPEQAEAYGADWDRHRELLEQTLATWSSSGVMRLGLFRGSVDGLVAFAAATGVEPDDPAVHTDYADTIGDQGGAVVWPPQRNAPCWCGSGAKYKKCCLPRSRG